MSSTPSGPPITRFKRSRRENTSGDASVSSGQGTQWDIDWEQVVRQEPEQVVAWIVYLHRSNETRPCMYVVNAAEWFVASEGYKPGCGQWKAYEETDLAGVLMDLLSEPDMFSLDDNTSKNMEYSNHIMSLLGLLLAAVVSFTRDDADIGAWGAGVFRRANKFCKALWNKRHLIPMMFKDDENTSSSANTDNKVSTSQAAACATLHSSILDCLAAVIELYRQPPGSDEYMVKDAIPILLYCWTWHVCDDSDESWAQSTNFLDAIRVVGLQDRFQINHAIAFCLESGGRPFHLKLVRAMKRTLRDDRSLESPSIYTIVAVFENVLSDFTFGFTLTLRSPDGESEETGLFSSLANHCLRVLCREETDYTFYTIAMAVRPIGRALVRSITFAGHDSTVRRRIVKYAGDFNLAAICSYLLVTSVQQSASRVYEDCTHILWFAERAMVNQDSVGVGEAPYPPEQLAKLRETSTRVWHDTLKTLRSMSTKGYEQAQLMNQALDLWVQHGNFLGLREGVNAATLQKPSKLANKPYWRIKKRCFWPACACAATHQACHDMRVCKGCWQVLYCSSRCQASDWKAGHRLVCKAPGPRRH